VLKRQVLERKVLTQILPTSEEDLAGVALDALSLEHQSPPLATPHILGRVVRRRHVTNQSPTIGVHSGAERTVRLMLLQQGLAVERPLATGGAGELRPSRVDRLSAARAVGGLVSVCSLDVSDQFGLVLVETGAVFVAARVTRPDVLHQHRIAAETLVTEVARHLMRITNYYQNPFRL
jgi:hypothetical protein